MRGRSGLLMSILQDACADPAGDRNGHGVPERPVPCAVAPFREQRPRVAVHPLGNPIRASTSVDVRRRMRGLDEEQVVLVPGWPGRLFVPLAADGLPDRSGEPVTV